MKTPSGSETLPSWLRPSALALFVGVLIVFRLWTASNAHLVEDEAYYRIWGLYPAFGYYDHPPMIAWWIWAGQQIAGDTALGVRLVGVLSAAVGSLVLWRTAAILFGRHVAGLAVLFFNASILIGVGGIIATPDTPSVFFWGLTLWALAELHVSGRADWWLAVGVFAGLGLVSKYSVLFLGAGIVLWLLWVPEARRWFASWQLWAGGGLALLCFAPVLVWNHGHEWASFYKQFGRAGRGDWTTKYVFEFLGALVGLLNPLVAVLAGFGVARLSRRTLARDGAASLIVLTLVPFLAYMLFHSLHARVQANWPAPLFPALALTAAVFAAAPGRRERLWQLWSAAAVGLGVLVAVVVQVHAVDPLTGRFARKDPTFQLRGWPQVTAGIRALADSRGAAYLATTGYGLTSQLSFAFAQELPVVQLNERIRYVMMPPVAAGLFDRPGLYVAEARRDNSARLAEVFDHVERVATLARTVNGVFLEDLVVYEIARPNRDPLRSVFEDPGNGGLD
ncbi:glycosyltransferase family 39 protein [Polymorphum gilvum]|uniref:Glycosyl transferase, family 39 n=1 Tax=Polymorphum gilvum (strain LMG 25793 / CGMCC 1.9160 / SL003B-26A1) TaxID=991905 RepID=F2J049_POLGS|nr:glycosyltransferase family 39 protein [Polymorphum gilvum]ADZ71883.1 Glycosyl transferase, family 39 [Polymorphum gilvum SL003B-26A1]